MRRFHSRILTLLAVALFAALTAFRARAADAPVKPNIIFVLVDDMGYGDLGCYRGKDIKTPNTDRLASEGVRMTDFYANAPVCSPTRCAFITGRWQQRVGFEWAMGYTAELKKRVDGKWVNEPDMHGVGLPTSEVTIANLLKDAGYKTGAFGKWHLGYKPEYNPVRRGFDEYFGTLLGHSDYWQHNYMDGTNEMREGEQPVKVEGYTTDLLNKRAVEFVRKHAHEPFFLYLPHQAVHAPYQPPGKPAEPVTKENMNAGDRQGYAQMLEKVDEGVGMLLDELDKQGIANNTLVVLSSDNGGAHFSDNSPLFNGKQSLWEGGIRVPCILRWPGHLMPGKVTRQMGITMDLTATFAALAGAKPAKDRPFDGIDLLPILSGQQPEKERTFFWRILHSNREQKAIRSGYWKYVLDGGYLPMLFHLDDDIGERQNLAIRNPQIVHELQDRLKKWETEMDAQEKEVMVR